MTLWAPRTMVPLLPVATLGPMREAIRREHKVAIVYCDEKGAVTQRTIWPIGIAFYEGKQTVAAWCELRDGFRHFRTDRIQEAGGTTARYPVRKATLVKKWRAEMEARWRKWRDEQKTDGQ